MITQGFSTIFLPFTLCQLPNIKFIPCCLFTHSPCRKKQSILTSASLNLPPIENHCVKMSEPAVGYCGKVEFYLNTLAVSVQIYRTWKSGKNQGYFSCLPNCIAPQRIVLESCSNPQKTWQVFESAMKDKRLLVLGFSFFVSDAISHRCLAIFGCLCPTSRLKHFAQVFIGN